MAATPLYRLGAQPEIPAPTRAERPTGSYTFYIQDEWDNYGISDLVKDEVIP